MPPRVPHADPGTPDSRGPARFLGWLVVRQLPRVLSGSLWGSLWMLALMLPPYLISRAVDDGLRARDMSSLGLWAGAVLGVGLLTAVLALLRHRTMTFVRIDASYRTVSVVSRHALRLGATLTGRLSAGEIVNVATTDIARIAQTLTVTGPGVGAVVSYVGATLLLVSIEPVLAVVVVVGVPLMAVVVGPLLGRLQTVETEYREQQAALATRAGDIVRGLRVLCGIGGKQHFADAYRRRSQALRAEGYRVGAVTSWVEAFAVGLPGLFLAAVTWLAARMAASGGITVGEMVAVYGYVATLVLPVFSFIEAGGDISRGLVSARRVVRVLNLPAPVEHDPVAGPAAPAPLHDPTSGLTVPTTGMLALVAAEPADARAVVDRLGRFARSDVTWGSVALNRVALAEVHRRILVAHDDASLFAGTLAEVVATHDDHVDGVVASALHAAAADDVLDGLPDGLASLLDAQARNLSGGQRQRLRLARALLADPETLLLVEPTSAVDAHTEALIAERVHAVRRGRATVVVTTSPLLLAHADAVAFLVEGRVTATGDHAVLLRTEPAYRALVHRGSEDDDAPARPGREGLG